MNNLKPTKLLFEAPKIGSHVGAVRSSTDAEVYFLGYGYRVEDSVPPPEVPGAISEDARAREMKVPCIELHDGTFVWGTECFWAPAEAINKWIGERRVIQVQPKRQKVTYRAQSGKTT